MCIRHTVKWNKMIKSFTSWQIKGFVVLYKELEVSEVMYSNLSHLIWFPKCPDFYCPFSLNICSSHRPPGSWCGFNRVGGPRKGSKTSAAGSFWCWEAGCGNDGPWYGGTKPNSGESGYVVQFFSLFFYLFVYLYYCVFVLRLNSSFFIIDITLVIPLSK